MATLADVADVQIVTSGAQLSKPAFQTPLVLSASDLVTDRVTFGSSIETLDDLGFEAGDPEYDAVAALLSPRTRISRFALGKLSNKPTVRWKITAVAANSTKYQLQLEEGVVAEYTSDANATEAEIYANLATAIAALTPSKDVTASNQTTSLRVVMDVAGEALPLKSLNRALLRVEMDHDDPGVAADLTAIEQSNKSWYGLVNPYNSTAMGNAIAGWVQPKVKLFVGDDFNDKTAQTSASGATDFTATTKANARDRTAAIYSSQSMAYHAAAWLGVMMTKDPGRGVTWAYKALTGQPSDELSDTEIENIRARNGNHYYELGGRQVAYPGVVGTGEYIDAIWGIDWLTVEMQTEVAALLMDSEFIPYTDVGAQIIAGAIFKVLERAMSLGFIARDPKPIVVVPKVSSVSSQDKAARILPDVRFEATLARAIHKVQVRGRLV